MSLNLSTSQSSYHYFCCCPVLRSFGEEARHGMHVLICRVPSPFAEGHTFPLLDSATPRTREGEIPKVFEFLLLVFLAVRVHHAC